jgi:hypothetical protein
MNHDGAGILHLVRRMLAGEALYVDIVDVNSPLMFPLGLPRVWLADLLGVPPRLGWVGAVLAAWAVLDAARLLCGRPERGAVVLADAFLLSLGAAGMLGEHFFLLLAFPWIVVRAAGVPAEGYLAVEAVALLRKRPQR